LLVCAITLVAAATLYGETVATNGLRQSLLGAPPADRAILVEVSAVPDQVATTDRLVTAELDDTLVLTGGEIARVVRSGSYAPAGSDRADGSLLVGLAAFEGIADHATLIAGSWATTTGDPSVDPSVGPADAPLGATLSEGAAGALHLGVGDSIDLASRLDPTLTVPVLVTGIWRPDRTDPYWLGNTLDLDGTQTTGQYTTRGPFVIDRDALLRLDAARAIALEWRALPDLGRLATDQVGEFRERVNSLSPRLGAVVVGSTPRVTTTLPATLGQVERSILVSHSGITLLTIQFAVLAGYAIVLVAGMLLERRRTDLALLRSRGASTVHLAFMALTEAAILATLAALAAIPLAALIVFVLGSVGPLARGDIGVSVTVDSAVLAVTIVAAVVSAVTLTVPTLLSALSPAGVRAAAGRPSGRSAAQRLGLDVVLVVVAIIAFWQLRIYGAPLTTNARGVLGVDPLLVAAPAIGLLAGAVVAIRLVPRLAQLAERLLVQRRGLVLPLTGQQIARRPLRYTRTALLLMLAASLGTFAASYAATWTRSQADQAAYRAGGDLRVVAPGYPPMPGWAVGPSYAAVQGVTDVTSAVQESVDVRRVVGGGSLLSVDPAGASRILTFPPGADGQPTKATPAALALLAAARPTTDALPIPGEPRRLAVTLDTALATTSDSPDPSPVPADWSGITVAADIIDGEGRLHRVEGGSARFAADGQRVEIPLTTEIDGRTVAIAGPVRLEGIELKVTTPGIIAVSGPMTIRAIEASDTDAGEAWTDTGFRADGRWEWVRADSLSGITALPPADAPLTVNLSGSAGSDHPVGGYGMPPVTFRLWAPPDDGGILPVVAGSAFLAATGAAVGEDLAASILGTPTTLRIVASVDAFPTLDPARPFLIADGTTRDLQRLDTADRVLPASEAWLSVDPTQAAAVTDILAGPAFAAAQVVGRDSLTAALATDPVPLGVIGVLGLGAIAAMAFAAIGFLVSATVSTNERRGEFALLRALGLSNGQLSLWLALENIFLLVVGLVLGSALGLLLCWLVLPFVTVTGSGAAAVPPPVIVIPWGAIVPIWVLGGILLLVTVVAVRRQLPSAAIGGVLRAEDG
jgi:ABC-type antimicrobial peptide transport system, permease component